RPSHQCFGDTALRYNPRHSKPTGSPRRPALPGGSMARRALLIGINKYLIPGADLRGCVNDVQDLTAVLTEFGGFKRRDITTLLDTKATRKAMMTGIKSLVRASKKGDVA